MLNSSREMHAGSRDAATDDADDAPRIFPAIYLRYWEEETSDEIGKGKTISFYYSQKDPSFQEHWEILYDW